MLWQPLGPHRQNLLARIMASTSATAAGSSERQAFAGASAEDLAEWLSGNGIAISSYGQGSAKSVAQLW